MTAAALRDGRGLAKFREFVRGLREEILRLSEDYSVFPQHSLTKQLRAGEGYVQKIEAKRIGAGFAA